jgi:hypothetical protein
MINSKQNMFQLSDIRSEDILKEHEKKLGKTQSQINITRSEFQRSFKNHYGMYKKTGTDMPYRSRLLMLFYSVECGLKSLILKNIGKNTYEELKSYYTINGKKAPGHDLKAMTKEVGIETKFPLKRIQLKGGGFVLPGKYNELWRYGACIKNAEEEQSEEKTLVRIAEWLSQRI